MNRLSSRNAAVLCSLMVLSGAASLMYEIVWLRMLTRAFGVNVHAMSFLVALYFGGLVLGSLAASRWTRHACDGLSAYAVLEAAGGTCALLATFWMLRLPGLVASIPGETDGGLLPLFLLGGPALMIPTFFFGATLPILSRHWITYLGEIRRGVGALYGANTLGAMGGVLAAGFFTIAYLGETVTVLLAAALNAAAAAAAFSMSRRSIPWKVFGDLTLRKPPPLSMACLLFAVSGFCAMGYELLWTRRLILLMGSSGYAFSLILLCYLGGTALGAAWNTGPEKDKQGLWGLFGRLELLLAAAALLSLGVYDLLGLRLDDPAYLYSPLRETSDLFALGLCACAVVLPSSIIMGYLFPVAARLETTDAQSAGPSVGRIYAYNTAGGIVGSLVVGFWGVDLLGTHGSFLALAGLNVCVGAAALTRSPRHARLPATAGLALLLFAAGFSARRDRTLDILTNRLAHVPGAPPRILFHEEAPGGTVTGVAAFGEHLLLINGIVISGTGINGALMTAIPNVFRENVARTLIVGVGVATTLTSASLLGGEVHAVDLLPPVVEHIDVFQPGHRTIYSRPGVHVAIGDGRNYLLRSRDPYDLVIVDGSPPLFSAGTVNLYTVDFLTLVRDRLNPEGIFTLWLPMPSFEEDYWDILKGMAAVFPHVAVWNHPTIKAGVLFFGSRQPLQWSPGVLEKRLQARVREHILTGLTEKKIREGFHITQADIRAYVRPFRLVTDDHPITEYPLGKLMRGEKFQETNAFILKAKGAAP